MQRESVYVISKVFSQMSRSLDIQQVIILIVSLGRISFDLACWPIKFVLLTQCFELCKSLGLVFAGNRGSREQDGFLSISWAC